MSLLSAYRSGITLTHETSFCEDWQPSVPPPRGSREKHYIRLKVTCNLETSPPELRESDSLLVPLPQFLADSQCIILRIFSQIHIHMPPFCADIISEKVRCLCRGALAVDRYRRVLPLRVDTDATASPGSLIYFTNAWPPANTLPEAVEIVDDKEAQCPTLPEAVATVDEKEAQCSICLDALGQRIVRMPCSHAFHNLCIAKWLQKNRTCPLCRCHITALSTASPPRRGLV